MSHRTSVTPFSGRDVILTLFFLELYTHAKTAKERCPVDTKHAREKGRLNTVMKAEFHDLSTDS